PPPARAPSTKAQDPSPLSVLSVARPCQPGYCSPGWLALPLPSATSTNAAPLRPRRTTDRTPGTRGHARGSFPASLGSAPDPEHRSTKLQIQRTAYRFCSRLASHHLPISTLKQPCKFPSSPIDS